MYLLSAWYVLGILEYITCELNVITFLLQMKKLSLERLSRAPNITYLVIIDACVETKLLDSKALVLFVTHFIA